MRLRLPLAALFVVLFSVVHAQTKLTGKVVNGKNEPVAGVSIKIVGAQGGTTSDVEGRYSLSLTANKKYELEFSAIGYVNKLVNEVEVGTGLDNELNIVLEAAAKNIEGVTVRATSRRQENTAALLSFQKNNIALSSGLASDFIRRTPDKNTGEVLKRVSGASIQDNRFVIVRGLSDRYNAAIINNAQLPSTEPDKKAFSFDVIPSALIDNIIINKTASPDLTGEFAGGLVQINTKDVPTKNFLSVGASFGFNTQSAFKDFISNERNSTDWLGFDNGHRALPKGFPKTAQAYRSLGGTTAGVQQQIELSKLFSNTGYAEKKTTALPTQSYSLTWGNSARTKNGGTFGTILSLQYRNSLLKYEVERRLNDDGGVNVQFMDDQNKYSVNVGALANFTYIKGRHKISFKNLFNQLLEDNYYVRNGASNDKIQDINFRSSVLNQRSLYSGQLEGEHQLTNNGIRLRWNGNFAYNSKSQPDMRTSAYSRSQGTSDPFEYNDDDTRRFFSELKDFSYGANGSLSFPFTLGSDKQTLKVGGSTLMRVRDFRSRIFRYEPASSQFDGAKELLPYDQIFAPENIAMDGFKLDEFTNNQDKYFAASANNGMYGMFDNKFGDMFRLVWGVRVENFQQFLTTKNTSAKREIINTEKWDVLPSFNFTLSPTTKQSIRLSGSRTVARPEFREIAPFSFYDYEANYGVNGNPALKRSAILNGDIRYEFYPKGGEAITIGGFYKSFDDPIELRLDASAVPDRRMYNYDNADKAYTIGAEFEVRKDLDFISQNLDAFNIFANLTYSYSKVTLGGSVTTARPLQGQSPYLVNAGLQYNSKNTIWSGSLLYNRVGQRLALVGNLEFKDIYERPRDQVDFQLAKKVFNKKGEIKITWADLLNPAFYFYENVDKKKAFSEGTDRLFNSYKPGSTITVGFTYDFNLGSKK
ncbi:TonB-dependent receptor [Terrimonas pollutisoli]|uniref:TonB-dependent receptor n=1 Tax=Terrimonas pollutisoli TaxID=3034147 RepID=UPI0023EDB2F1|nr:TonB-dependent receptor [Terrimonas sp. H1YJ31]